MMRTVSAWLTVMLVAAGGATGAQAQTADAPEVYAAVYDFAEPSGYGGRMIGLRAAEALHSALAEAGPWRLIKRPDLLRQCASEDVRAPFGVGYLQMFGRRLNAPLAVCGLVQNLVVNATRGSAQVTLVGELIETSDGNSLASVRAVGSALRDGDATVALDELIARALVEATGDLALALSAFDAWTTTVVTGLSPTSAMLNTPADTDVQPGTKLLVFRPAGGGWSIVAAAQALRGDKNTIRVKILTEAAEALKPGDVAVAVAR